MGAADQLFGAVVVDAGAQRLRALFGRSLRDRQIVHAVEVEVLHEVLAGRVRRQIQVARGAQQAIAGAREELRHAQAERIGVADRHVRIPVAVEVASCERATGSVKFQSLEDERTPVAAGSPMTPG